ncbi:unnamed protein product, partial [Prorocentrum cordatum]
MALLGGMVEWVALRPQNHLGAILSLFESFEVLWEGFRAASGGPRRELAELSNLAATKDAFVPSTSEAVQKFCEVQAAASVMQLQNMRMLYGLSIIKNIGAMSFRWPADSGAPDDVRSYMDAPTAALVGALLEECKQHAAASSQSASALVAALETNPTMTLGAFFGQLGEELIKCGQVVKDHPYSELSHMKVAFINGHSRLSNKDLESRIAEAGLPKVNLTMFPNQKMSSLDSLCNAVVGKANPNHVLAEALRNAGECTQVFGSRLMDRVRPPPEATTALVKAVGGDGTTTKTAGAAKPELEPSTPEKLWLAALHEEGGEESVQTILHKKVARLTQHFLDTSMGGPSAHGNGLDRISVNLAPTKAGGVKLGDVVQTGKVATRLNIWGRVVTADVAQNVIRSNVMYLGSSHGLSLFVDGTAVQQYGKSDLCVGWLVKPIKVQPKTEAAPEDPQGAKKRKKAAKKIEDEIATHEVGSSKWSTEVSFMGHKFTFSYNVPHLDLIIRDGATDDTYEDLPLRRQLSSLDTDDDFFTDIGFVTPQKKAKLRATEAFAS